MKKTVIGIGLAAALAGTAQAGSTKTVKLEGIAYTPATVRIKAGDSIRWVWKDGPDITHDVTSRGRRRFKSSTTKATGSYRRTFTKPGTYAYYCTQHPDSMKGKVIVR